MAAVADPLMDLLGLFHHRGHAAQWRPFFVIAQTDQLVVFVALLRVRPVIGRENAPSALTALWAVRVLAPVVLRGHRLAHRVVVVLALARRRRHVAFVVPAVKATRAAQRLKYATLCNALVAVAGGVCLLVRCVRRVELVQDTQQREPGLDNVMSGEIDIEEWLRTI